MVTVGRVAISEGIVDGCGLEIMDYRSAGLSLGLAKFRFDIR